MKPKKLPYDQFLLSFRLSPRLAVEILVENKAKEILLLKRSTKPYKNYWHLPGGFLLKGEKIGDCAQRLTREELGKKLPYDLGEFLGLFETIGNYPRGHFLHYVLRFKLDIPKDELKGGFEYFKIMPKGIIPYQKKFLKELGYK